MVGLLSEWIYSHEAVVVIIGYPILMALIVFALARISDYDSPVDEYLESLYDQVNGI